MSVLFGNGAGEFGVLSSVMAIGSLVGALLAGLDEPDAGIRSARRGARIGYLAQEDVFAPGQTAHEVVVAGLAAESLEEHERITRAAIALSQHGTVAPTMIASRVDFAASMTDGRTAQELDPSSRSAAEITELWSYLSSRMNGAAHG